MKDRSEDQQALAEKPNQINGFVLGLLAGIGFAIVYGLAAEPVNLSFGLVGVGALGGVLIGGAVSRGAFAGQPHLTDRRLQLVAAAIATGAGIVALFVAYVMSQLLFPEASTPLLERISLGGFVDYFAGLFDMVRVAHGAAIAAAAFMGWRGAR